MQEVELTNQLLKDFSLNFAKVPNVCLKGLEFLPFDVRILAAWVTELEATGASSYLEIFQAYLCGRELFLEEMQITMEQFQQQLGLIVRAAIEARGQTVEQCIANQKLGEEDGT